MIQGEKSYNIVRITRPKRLETQKWLVVSCMSHKTLTGSELDFSRRLQSLPLIVNNLKVVCRLQKSSELPGYFLETSGKAFSLDNSSMIGFGCDLSRVWSITRESSKTKDMGI